MTSKRPDLRLLPDPEFPLLGGADDWIYNAAAAPGADDWEPMADGYHQAAEIVAEHLAERPGFRGYLTSPLLFLCRHSLELRIKGIIANSADLLDTPVDLIHDHHGPIDARRTGALLQAVADPCRGGHRECRTGAFGDPRRGHRVICRPLQPLSQPAAQDQSVWTKRGSRWT